MEASEVAVALVITKLVAVAPVAPTVKAVVSTQPVPFQYSVALADVPEATGAPLPVTDIHLVLVPVLDKT